jgi:3-keto-disaccharide hydrolase
MRTLSLLAAVLTASLSLAAEPVPPKGFTAIFNGKDLTGWHGWAIHAKGAGPLDFAKLSPEERKKQIAEWTADANKHWTVENGELVNDGKGAYLTTDKAFGDIELLIDYKTVAKADSGIYLRATPQVQIWDTTKEGGKWDRGADKGSGGLFNNTKGAAGQLPLILADNPFGEWNRFRILMVGERVTVYLNDKLVVDMARMENYWNRKLPLAKTGPILLQTHGGEIRWRNMFVREIPWEEANAILRKRDAAGFVDMFNGKDLTGWTGGKDGYEVKDALLVNMPKKGGNLYTEAEFADFAARVEYKMPAGGNNGLAIRYPGKGQPSTTAMCEVQILDNDAPKHAKIDPRQANGSVYGMIAAHRGYDRPIGEWNFMEVVVQGPKITVELNGTRIVDADVSQVKEFLDNKEHPGKDRTSGHFGFAGHGDPVAFRNIRIRAIK